MLKFIDKKVLITTNDWFYGKDGRSYRAVHGTLKAVHEASIVLGFAPNRTHANWFIEVGEMMILGCQVLHVIECETVYESPVGDYTIDPQSESGIKKFLRPSAIYVVS